MKPPPLSGIAGTESEVERLNQLNEGKEIRYFWVFAPYFPEGRGVDRA